MDKRLNNNFWTLRSKHGRDKIFSDPQVLLEAVGEYFETIDDTPWHKNEAIKGGEKAGEIVKLPTQQPYTIKGGLCHFLDIDHKTWLNYREDPRFTATIERIEEFVFNQKFVGATVGAFNHNIIARDLGLKDNQDVTSGGESIGKGFFDLVKKKQTVKEEKPGL
jgi:hypothetical protein